MAGIYLHIPFCKQACTYCNFHFSTSLHYKDELIKALAIEAVAERDYLQGEAVGTVYFGGGTPSLLTTEDCRSLLGILRKTYSLSADAEITLEANPDDITRDKLLGWKDAGINRLSIGVQSFFEEELRWMNRAHNAEQAIRSIELARKEFDNITMDLIYGSPLLTDEMWKENVKRAVDYGVPHLSCYALTVEEKTPLHKMIRSRVASDVESERQAGQFLLLMQWLREKGYEHYEVSNFAKPGFRSKHNSSYWKGTEYLGLGPSAHSFNGRERRWNISNNSRYLAGSAKQEFERESELLTPLQQLNEYVMISLRTAEGLDLSRIENDWGFAQKERIAKLLSGFGEEGLLRFSGNFISLTDLGMLRADGIASEAFA